MASQRSSRALPVRPSPPPRLVAALTVAAAAAALVAGARAGPAVTPTVVTAQQPRHVQALAERVALPDAPSDLAAGAGSMWVAAKGAVLQLSRSGDIVRAIRLPRAAHRQIALGAGAIWVTDEHRGDVERVNLTDGWTGARVHVGTKPVALAVARDVWVLRWHHGVARVLRIDPRRMRITGSWRLGGLTPRPILLAAGRTAWTNDGGRLVSFGESRVGTSFLGSVIGLTRAGDELWASVSTDHRVSELVAIEASSGSRGERVTLDRGESGPVAVLGGRTWVAQGDLSPGPHRIVIVDRSRLIGEATSPSPVAAMASGLGAVWTADADGRELTRFTLPTASG